MNGVLFRAQDDIEEGELRFHLCVDKQVHIVCETHHQDNIAVGRARFTIDGLCNGSCSRRHITLCGSVEQEIQAFVSSRGFAELKAAKVEFRLAEKRQSYKILEAGAGDFRVNQVLCSLHGEIEFLSRELEKWQEEVKKRA